MWCSLLYILAACLLRDVVLTMRSLCALKKLLNPFRVLKNGFGPSIASNSKQRLWSIKHMFWRPSCTQVKCECCISTNWKLFTFPSTMPVTNILYWMEIPYSRYRSIREIWAAKHWIHSSEELSSLGWSCHLNGWQSPAKATVSERHQNQRRNLRTQ